MNITAAKYFRDSNNTNSSVLVVADGVTFGVPVDPQNAALLLWVNAGNSIANADN
jgi:hypothetical protein